MDKGFGESILGTCAKIVSIGVSVGIALGIPQLIRCKHVEKVNDQKREAANTAIKAAREGDEEKKQLFRKAHDKMTYGVSIEKD